MSVVWEKAELIRNGIPGERLPCHDLLIFGCVGGKVAIRIVKCEARPVDICLVSVWVSAALMS